MLGILVTWNTINTSGFGWNCVLIEDRWKGNCPDVFRSNNSNRLEYCLTTDSGTVRKSVLSLKLKKSWFKSICATHTCFATDFSSTQLCKHLKNTQTISSLNSRGSGKIKTTKGTSHLTSKASSQENQMGKEERSPNVCTLLCQSFSVKVWSVSTRWATTKYFWKVKRELGTWESPSHKLV